jgi:malonyl CoA-acyl carrier protein transacylase
VVSALAYLQTARERGVHPDFAAGHSLGEYSALFAAGVFDFATGLRLVQHRGELMSQATGGGMAAVVGMRAEIIHATLRDAGLTDLDVANYNAPEQTVIAGPVEQIERAEPVFKAAGVKAFIRLKVSAAFHSRYMHPTRLAFEQFLTDFEFAPPKFPVIANVTAAPHQFDQIKTNLVNQIDHSVRWVETVQLLLKRPEPEFEEIGPGKVLSRLLAQIQPR